MTTLHLLALAGYFIVLFEFIAMRHRVICAESDARIDSELRKRTIIARRACQMRDWNESTDAQIYYLNRGTK